MRLLSLLVTDVFLIFSHSSSTPTRSFIDIESIMSNDCCRGNQMNGRALSTRANVSPRQGSVSSATYR